MRKLHSPGWLGFDTNEWTRLCDEARDREQVGRAAPPREGGAGGEEPFVCRDGGFAEEGVHATMGLSRGCDAGRKALAVWACVRCGGRLQGAGVPDNSLWGERHCGAPGTALGACEAGPSTGPTAVGGVLRLKQSRFSRSSRPGCSLAGGASGLACAQSRLHRLFLSLAHSSAAPVSGPPPPLCISPHPQHYA